MQGRKNPSQSETQLAVLGHELRNALCGVSGIAEQLKNTRLSPEQHLLIQTLHSSSLQLRWLIASVGLDAGSSGISFTPQAEQLNGMELMEQVIRCHTSSAIRKKNLLLLTVEPRLSSWWFCDGRLLRLMLDNLLGNAVKFTRCGEIILEARSTTHGPATQAGLEIRVRDSGSGIEENARSRIFDPWVQLEGSQDNSGGSGLGLHVCQRIVSAMGGTIEYSCTKEQGSCFKVWLPGVVESRLQVESFHASSLLSSLACHVSASENIQASVQALLNRLGVDQVRTGTPCDIHITGKNLSAPAKGRENSLLLTHQSPMNDGRQPASSRLLALPFLESTLGPALMEMALEKRLCQGTMNQSDPW